MDYEKFTNFSFIFHILFTFVFKCTIINIIIGKGLIKLKQDIFSMFNLQNIELNSKLCINYKNKNLVCNKCIDICPTDALELVNNVPVINNNKCTNCGYCISTCDVLAFDNIKSPYSEIINQINEFPESNITCDNAENHSKGIKVPCYLNIDLNILLQLNKYKKTVSFYLGNCSTCLKAELNTIQDHVLDLQKQLNELSIPLTIKTYNTKLNEEDNEIINGLTRRELFQKISLKKFRNFKFEEEGDSNKNKITNILLKEKNLYKRRLFNGYIAEKKSQININVISKMFTSIEISDMCNGCGICEKICPTEAITWHNDSNSNNNLMFNNQACIACQKCSACPENAIMLNNISFNEYINSENKILASFKLVKCTNCGDSFRTNESNEICSLCQRVLEQSHVNFFN